MIQGEYGRLVAIIITLWVVFQTGCKLYFAANPEKAVEEIRKRLKVPFGYVIAGYFGWCFAMLTAFYVAGLYNF